MMCKRRKYIGLGLLAETLSGSDIDSQPICHIGNPTKVKHIVRVTNKSLHLKADVICKGRIMSNPKKVKFLSDQSTDTDSQWSSETYDLESDGQYTFDHVRLSPISPNYSGSKEKVHMEIEAFWPERGFKSASGELNIEVILS